MGVGSLKSLNADWSSAGMSSWSKERIGVTGSEPSGTCIVTECFARNASTSADDDATAVLLGFGLLEDEVASFLCFFLSLFELPASASASS